MEYENIEPSSANVKIEPVNINLKNYSNCDCLGSFYEVTPVDISGNKIPEKTKEKPKSK